MVSEYLYPHFARESSGSLTAPGGGAGARQLPCVASAVDPVVLGQFFSNTSMSRVSFVLAKSRSVYASARPSFKPLGHVSK